jgi:hypothetical protein
MDDLVEELQTVTHAGRKWTANLSKLSDELHEHLREEEKSFFQLGGKILTDRQKTGLAKKYRKEYLVMHKRLASE